MKNIRLYLVDLFLEIFEREELTQKKIDCYKLKLQMLKEIANIIKNDNENVLKEIEENFEFVLAHGVEAFKIQQEKNEIDMKAFLREGFKNEN
jgi:hypothetical protein